MSKRAGPSIGAGSARRFARCQCSPAPLSDRDLLAEMLDLFALLVHLTPALHHRHAIIDRIRRLQDSADAPDPESRE